MDNDSSPGFLSVKKCCDRLFNSGWSLHKIRDTILQDRFFDTSEDAIGVPGRSIVWKLFLTVAEPLQTSMTLNLSNTQNSLRSSRKAYTDLLLEKMRAPDGSYEEGFVPPALVGTLRKREIKAAVNLDTNNPLSLHDENPWRKWFSAVELRKTILQDVERTFPDISFFRDAMVQQQLTNILFLYSVMNPVIGYRQGMHELLAPLYYVAHHDAMLVQQGLTSDSSLEELCSGDWVAADAWSLFVGLMRGVSRWYEWQDKPGPSKFKPHLNFNVPASAFEVKPYVAPVVETCNQIQNTHLRVTDPALWQHLQSSGIEPQLYGIRWLRLLFTREFSMAHSMKIWDGLFVCDPTIDLAPWICVAMLIRIRQDLLSTDYSGQLTLLLRYPAPADTSDAQRYISSLLRQAQILQSSPTAVTGVSVALENRNQLDIGNEASASDFVSIPVQDSRNHPQRHHKSASVSFSKSPTNPSNLGGPGHTRQQTASQIGLPEMITRGLLERGESLGINKTFMTAVSEIRRNIPDISASFARPSSATSMSFPLEDERTSEERPPWEPRTRFEMENDISQLRSRNKRLGESLGWIVDALLQDESDVQDKAVLQKRKQEALESLSYVRDVLMGAVEQLEEDRLTGEEEKRRRAARESQTAKLQPQHRALNLPPPVAAIPISPTETRFKQPLDQRLSQSPPSSASSIQTPRSAVSPSFPPSTSPPKLAPWSYTQSSFSRSSPGLPPTSLPRPPPRASKNAHGPPSADASKARAADQTPRFDPLGALP
ncbi:RabGAP/TBC [Pluteus cervinus]|uniref:RabGAP/TBC n=1 Tax=Pluteus cervinus TaxID=181527 RepID=A0ACD3BFU7_9AGAR|nr:RabGAP/TBC [Pluteus cervinus]